MQEYEMSWIIPTLTPFYQSK